MTTLPLTVALTSWSRRHVFATVDGVRVTVRRNTRTVRWICSEHGESVGTPDHCHHLRALAAAPADPTKNEDQ